MPFPSCSTQAHATLKKCKTEEIRKVIHSFLHRCDMSFPLVEFDEGFNASCRLDALRRGYPVDGPHSIGPFIPGGVVMATTAYAHLTNKATQMFIALYTTFLIYLDDVFQHHIDSVREFNERFMLQKSQGDPVLDSFASLLLELPKHFTRVVTNIVVTSTLNLVTALLLEHETKGMKLRVGAHGYPTFSRAISGASEAYALFVFPPELTLPTFIQALPEMMVYINNGNDILSFYKEELAGESVNRVSIIAALRGTSKHEALWDLADEAVDAHSRIMQILQPHPVAVESYIKFSHGYLGFHAGLPRYKLAQLVLRSTT